MIQTSNITLRLAIDTDRAAWNHFVKIHVPPVGAFMQTWEWGTFQESMGKKIERYFIVEKGIPIACALVVYQMLPFGFSYAYLPRGPVVSKEALRAGKLGAIFTTIKTFAHSNPNKIIFLRVEPPIPSLDLQGLTERFTPLSYYVQPRYNHTIPLDVPIEEIIKRFHSSTRSNIHRAENRGVTVSVSESISAESFEEFFGMIADTITRNHGKNAYPSRVYFQKLLELANGSKDMSSETLSVRVFSGFQNGEPAATHIVMFFGTTATYLFGAAYTNKLNSKVVTYLHYKGMAEARDRGYQFYDLGGIDPLQWPAITEFKRQFHGVEFEYVGNIDIPVKPLLYHLYNIFRMIWK